MESNLSAYHKEEEGTLIANVWALRNQLMKTERSLQHLGEQLYSDGSSEHSSSRPSSAATALTLEDLEQPECTQNISRDSSEKMSLHKCDSQRRSRGQLSAPTASYRQIEQENKQFREQLNSLREQNASLVSQNHYLMKAVEPVQSGLPKSKTRISFFESALGRHSSSVPQLEEQVLHLEAEFQAQEKALRDAEDRLEQSQQRVAEKERIVQRFSEELKKLKLELLERSKQGKRAEQQRNEALLHAEELTKAFQQYKEKISEKLEKVQEEEDLLQTKLLNSENEREKLREKLNALKTELENLKEQFRLLKSDTDSGKERQQRIDAKNTELIALLTQSNQRILKLESELDDKENILAQSNDTRLENKELKSYITQQNERLLLCQNQIEDSKSELSNLKILSQIPFDNEAFTSKWKGPEHQLGSSSTKADVYSSSCEPRTLIEDRSRTKLSNKEEEMKKIRTHQTSSKLPQHLLKITESQGSGELQDLEAEPVKLIENQAEERKCQRLELACKQLEKEKEKHLGQIEALRAKLTKAEADISSLKNHMSQRTNQFQIIQEELLEKADRSSKLERELAKKQLQISALENQLEEKKIAYLSISARNTELEELLERNSQMRNLEQSINREHKEAILSFENAQKMNLQHQKELEEHIELLQGQLDKNQSHFKDQDKTIAVLQQDIISKQRKIELLDRMLSDSKMEMEKQTIKNGETMKILQNQVAEETIQVRQLDSALAVCKEELGLYFHQLEENKNNFEKQITKKSEEVQRLQKELKLKSLSLQETSEQNARLQQTLQQQQHMLHQGTMRIGELEDSQAELEKQVSKLEQDLQKQKITSTVEYRKVEEKLRTASQKADLKSQRVLELTSKMKEINLEMAHGTEALAKKQEELTRCRSDCETKTKQLSHLEITFQQTQSELDKMTALVTNLQTDLRRSEAERLNVLQRREELESEMQGIQEELNNTVRRLKELQDMLQSTQLSLEEKKSVIKDLTSELRHCKSEIEDRDQELVDMNQALKERNWELKQRAAQVTQLDMNIREHRSEMEQTLIRLEGALKTSELEIKDYINQIANLDEKLQHTKDQLREKDFEVLQKDQELNQQKKEIERKQLKIADLEKTMKDQEQCIVEQHHDGLDVGQQVRQSREQIQHLQLELMEISRQLVQAQRETDRLKRELEETACLSREKETRANKLAEELGAAQASQTQIEVHLQTKIKKLKAEIVSLKDFYQQEIVVLQKSNEKVIMCTDNQKSTNQYLSEQLHNLMRELEEAKDKISNLQIDLQARNEVIQATNEALLVKESEVTRLKTRISGYERTAGVRHLQSPFDSSPQRLAVLNVQHFSPHRLMPASKYRMIRRSISASDLSLKEGTDSLNISPSMMDDLHYILPEPAVSRSHDRLHATTDDPEESSFNPLAYTVDEDAVDSSSDDDDFGTLSRMLRYINADLKPSETSLAQTSSKITTAETKSRVTQ